MTPLEHHSNQPFRRFNRCTDHFQHHAVNRSGGQHDYDSGTRIQHDLDRKHRNDRWRRSYCVSATATTLVVPSRERGFGYHDPCSVNGVTVTAPTSRNGVAAGNHSCP